VAGYTDANDCAWQSCQPVLSDLQLPANRHVLPKCEARFDVCASPNRVRLDRLFKVLECIFLPTHPLGNSSNHHANSYQRLDDHITVTSCTRSTSSPSTKSTPPLHNRPCNRRDLHLDLFLELSLAQDCEIRRISGVLAMHHIHLHRSIPRPELPVSVVVLLPLLLLWDFVQPRSL
jgi:hypothetical protein